MALATTLPLSLTICQAVLRAARMASRFALNSAFDIDRMRSGLNAVGDAAGEGSAVALLAGAVMIDDHAPVPAPLIVDTLDGRQNEVH